MKINQTFKYLLVLLGLLGLTLVAKADYTNNMLARWTFPTGTSADLTDGFGGYKFIIFGNAPTYNVGSVTLDRFTELMATNINCKTFPALSNTATVWVKMRFDVTNNANPAFLFGLMNTNTQAGGDYPTVAMVAINANYGSGFKLGQQSLSSGVSYATIFTTTPATNVYFTMACVLQTGHDQNGYVNAGLTEFQTYVNGTLVGSGSAAGSNVLSQAFALGRLKAGGGQACTFAEARVYNQSLTAVQVSQIAHVVPAVPTNGLLAHWTFSTGTSADLLSDDGNFPLIKTGTEWTYNPGYISFTSPGVDILVANDINSANYPQLATSASIWVSMSIDSAQTALDCWYFGLMNTNTRADYPQVAMVGRNYSADSVTLNLGMVANAATNSPAGVPATSGSYGPNFVAPPPASGQRFTMGLVMTAGQDLNGNPSANSTRFETYIDGVKIGSGAAVGSNVISQSFMLGELKNVGYPSMSYDEVRMYATSLTSNQVVQLDWPTAKPDTAATTKNVALTNSPLANDTDPHNYQLSLVSVSGTNCTATIQPDGTNVLITPTAGFAGTAYVAYTITNNSINGGTNSSLITIAVTSLPPVANPDTASTAWNTPVTVSPLANDTDPYSYPLTVLSVSVTNCTASIIGGTNVLVTPTNGAPGTAYVAYTITNSNGGTASSLITVTLTNPPPANPTANPDTATTAWNVPVKVAPLANDSDPNSYPLTVVSVNPTNATASIIGGTNVLVTPTLGAAGTATVGYSITNNNVNGGTASSLITVTVTTPPTPVVTSAVQSGSGLVMSGTNGAAKGVYLVLSSTNVALPVASWTPVLTNTFDAGGGFNVTNPINPANSADFFLIKQ